MQCGFLFSYSLKHKQNKCYHCRHADCAFPIHFIGSSEKAKSSFLRHKEYNKINGYDDDFKPKALITTDLLTCYEMEHSLYLHVFILLYLNALLSSKYLDFYICFTEGNTATNRFINHNAHVQLLSNAVL